MEPLRGFTAQEPVQTPFASFFFHLEFRIFLLFLLRVLMPFTFDVLHWKQLQVLSWSWISSQKDPLRRTRAWVDSNWSKNNSRLVWMEFWCFCAFLNILVRLWKNFSASRFTCIIRPIFTLPVCVTLCSMHFPIYVLARSDSLLYLHNSQLCFLNFWAWLYKNAGVNL